MSKQPPRYDDELPQYNSGDTRAAASDAKKPPLEPIELGGRRTDWDFVLKNHAFTSDVSAFVSADSLSKYNLYRSCKPGTAQHRQATQLNAQGIGIPLLRTDVHSLALMHSKRYMTIYRYRAPPAGSNRLFDHKVDRAVFCEVTKERCASYYRYVFRFRPHDTDRSADFVLCMFHHHRWPIADISPYKGQRLRWVYGRVWTFKTAWFYALNCLGEGQPSLVDGWDAAEMRVARDNQLLGSAWKNNLLPSLRDRSTYLGTEVGVVLDSQTMRSWFGGPRARFGYIEETLHGGSESATAVSTDAMVFLCMAMIFKRIEDIKEAARSSGGS
ncbi:Uncharacterized protein ABC855_g1048 [[Candida] zeylanoides]